MRIFGDNLPTFTHWFSWALAIIASIIFSYFLITDDIPALLKNQNAEMTVYVTLILLGIIGTIWSVFNQTIGGVIMLIGGVGLVAYYYFLGGWKDANLMIAYGLPYILPGFLMLLIKK